MQSPTAPGPLRPSLGPMQSPVGPKLGSVGNKQAPMQGPVGQKQAAVGPVVSPVVGTMQAATQYAPIGHLPRGNQQAALGPLGHPPGPRGPVHSVSGHAPGPVGCSSVPVVGPSGPMLAHVGFGPAVGPVNPQIGPVGPKFAAAVVDVHQQHAKDHGPELAPVGPVPSAAAAPGPVQYQQPMERLATQDPLSRKALGFQDERSNCEQVPVIALAAAMFHELDDDPSDGGGSGTSDEEGDVVFDDMADIGPSPKTRGQKAKAKGSGRKSRKKGRNR